MYRNWYVSFFFLAILFNPFFRGRNGLVSALNLGMIAASDNISCESPSLESHPMAYPPVRCDG